MTNDKYADAYGRIAKANKVLLVTHNRPDGDALASTCALADFLLGIGKKVSAYCLDRPSAQYGFLPHMEMIGADRESLEFGRFDLVIALDCGSLARTNLADEIKGRSKGQSVIEFDHHPKADDYADIEIRDPRASSTAEILYRFFKASGIKINKNMAGCILAGILADTGNFLYPSTTDATVKIASEMLIYGARFPTILDNTWRNKSLPAMRVWGRAISNLRINKRYNIAFSVLTREDIAAGNIADEELEGISGFLSNLHGVNGLVFLREEEGDGIKGSLRTASPGIDISRLAAVLGGGGHAKASAFVASGRLGKENDRWRVE